MSMSHNCGSENTRDSRFRKRFRKRHVFLTVDTTTGIGKKEKRSNLMGDLNGRGGREIQSKIVG